VCRRGRPRSRRRLTGITVSFVPRRRREWRRRGGVPSPEVDRRGDGASPMRKSKSHQHRTRRPGAFSQG
jgi:hypothetical protein